ncbi:hypothetical protein [Mycobacteroides abscessus]|uniref:hypothetical protein n=1 Tax=Mycobacteroides abscessus TaxID=36809 RepID=UPI001F41715F|nr:hypothetical protein [Mycobacteroides abscessus]
MQSDSKGAESEQPEGTDSAPDSDWLDPAVLTGELTSLLSSQGLTENALGKTPTLRKVMAAIGGHSATNNEASMTYLKTLLEQEGQREFVQAYRNALRFGPIDKPGLDTRREDFAKLEGCSPDTIKRYENKGINELVIQLCNRVAHTATPNAQAVSATPIEAVSAKSTVLFVDRFSLYEGRVLKEVTSSKTIRAEVSNRQIRKVRFRLRTDSEKVRIEAVDGCTIESSERHWSGFLISKIKLSRILQPGDDPLTYTTRYVIDTDIPCDPFIIYSTPPTSRIEKARLRVKFSTPPIPTTAWWRENRTKDQAETDPPGEPLIIDENGSMQHTFTNLTPGLCQIVAWEWPDDRQ